MSVAATVITPLQLAGVKPLASELLLPAATATTIPAALTSLIALCQAAVAGSRSAQA